MMVYSRILLYSFIIICSCNSYPYMGRWVAEMPTTFEYSPRPDQIFMPLPFCCVFLYKIFHSLSFVFWCSFFFLFFFQAGSKRAYVGILLYYAHISSSICMDYCKHQDNAGNSIKLWHRLHLVKKMQFLLQAKKC